MAEYPRIVVTGLGAVTPYGVGVSLFWDGIISGRSALHETADEYLRQWSPVMGHVTDFDPSAQLGRKLTQNTDRFTHLGMVAALEALHDAGWANPQAMHEQYDKDNVGIAIGCTLGGVQTLEDGAGRIASGRSNRVSARLVPKAIPNSCAATIATQFDIHGPSMTYSAACASSANSIGEASYWLRTGAADMVIAGGTECLFSPAILSGLHASGALAIEGPADFSAWSRPFDQQRRGMVMSEGAAMLVLETLEHAQERNAHIYAELIGYGSSNDAYHETLPHPSGHYAQLAMQRALKAAHLQPEDIDYINAHATATVAGDRAEATALRGLFGAHLAHIPVSSIKGAVGHMLGAAGAIESIVSIKAINESVLPPTLHCDEKEEGAPPDVVPNQSRSQRVVRALSNSFGFGGQNSVLIWQSAELL